MELTLRMTESFSTFISKEEVTINTEDYPELAGKTEEEIKEYITQNLWEMAPPADAGDWADSLGDYLDQMEVVREKNTNEERELYFD